MEKTDASQSLDSEARHLITRLRFLSVAAIVCLHSQVVYIDEPSGEFPDRFLQEWACSWLLRVGLPMLSAISGYLLMSKWQFTFAWYRQTLDKRAVSLLIPFVSVSLLTILAYAVIQINPATSDMFGGKPIIKWNLAEWWHHLFVIPLNYPIYFLRDLYAVVLLSPLLVWMLRTRNRAILSLLGLGALWWMQIHPWFWNIRIILWFAVGGALAMHPTWRWKPNTRILVTLTIIWLTLSALGAWNAALAGERSIPLNHACKLLGVFLFFFWTSRISQDGAIGRWVTRFAAASFPLFLFHNPIVNFTKKLGVKILGDSFPMASVVWLITALVSIAVLLLLVIPVGRKFGGKVWSFLTGGR